MKILVIGAGLIGVTTAYYLRRRGYEVSVIEREMGAGRQTSFANGALLAPGMSEPWNAPGIWRTVLRSLLGANTAVKVRLGALPALGAWGTAFLRHSEGGAYERNTLSNLRLALYSLGVLKELRDELGIEYGRSAAGILKIFRDPAAFERAAVHTRKFAAFGLVARELSVEETIEIEPALEPIRSHLVGSLYHETDETGDAFRFCEALTKASRASGVEFLFGTEVTSLEAHSGRVMAVRASGRVFQADRYVVAAASYSAPLLRCAGVDLPIRPAKGYSLTIDCAQNAMPLRVPIVDDQLHAAVVPLQQAIRVAGTAEFVGYDLSVPPSRIENLRSLLHEVLPQASIRSTTEQTWCGLRAMCADGVPVIGQTPVSNLNVNTGHGHLGWTMATGSAALIADLIAGTPTAIDSRPYAFARFN